MYCIEGKVDQCKCLKAIKTGIFIFSGVSRKIGWPATVGKYANCRHGECFLVMTVIGDSKLQPFIHFLMDVLWVARIVRQRVFVRCFDVNW